MKKNKKYVVRMVVAVAASSTLGAANAAEPQYPTKSVRMIVPFAPGGPTDVIARFVAAKLSESFGHQVVIDNRAGAGGNIGMGMGASATPDGYTLTIVSSSFVVNPGLYAKIPYDPYTSFAPVTNMAASPNVYTAHPSVAAKSMPELIKLIQANPKKYSFATPGIGTTPHFTAELFKKMADIDITHVPYRGVAAGAMSDLLTNRIDSMFNTTGSLLQAVRSGQVRGLAQSTPQRSPLAPELPTFAEAGVPGFNVSSWYGLFVPAKTPPDIVKKMHDDTAKMLTEPETKKKYEVLGIEAASATADQMAALMKNEIALWTPIIKAANIKGE